MKFYSALLLSLTTHAVAHGDPDREFAERKRFLEIHTNNLNHCAERHAANGFYERATERRHKRAASMMAPSSLQALKGRFS